MLRGFLSYQCTLETCTNTLRDPGMHRLQAQHSTTAGKFAPVGHAEFFVRLAHLVGCQTCNLSAPGFNHGPCKIWFMTLWVSASLSVYRLRLFLMFALLLAPHRTSKLQRAASSVCSNTKWRTEIDSYRSATHIRETERVTLVLYVVQIRFIERHQSTALYNYTSGWIYFRLFISLVCNFKKQ